MKQFAQKRSLLIGLVILSGLLALSILVGYFRNRSPNLVRLPHFYVALTNSEKYRVKPYIAAAVAFQTMGRPKAEKQMMEYAKKGWDSDGVFILCRMLYVKRPSSKFEGPGLGLPVFIGGTDWKDWPLNPIHIQNGIPFLIATDYALYGEPPNPTTYLEYCITNCDWNSFSYENKNDQELQSALKDMLTLPKWRRSLTQDEKEWLTSQIR